MARKNRIEAAVFDLGNVVVLYDFEKAWKELANAPEQRQRVERLFGECERGQISSEEFVGRALSTLGLPRESHEKFKNIWANIFALNQPIVDLIDFLQNKGAKLYYLSNTSQIHLDYLKREYPDTFQKFEGGVASYEVKCVKPEPTIFQITIDKFASPLFCVGSWI
jgi:putative hydrolase of the HAD superfamily